MEEMSELEAVTDLHQMTSHARKLFKIWRERVSYFATNLAENSTRKCYMKHSHPSSHDNFNAEVIEHKQEQSKCVAIGPPFSSESCGDRGCNLQGGDQGNDQDKEAKNSYNYHKAYNYLRERGRGEKSDHDQAGADEGGGDET
ncbi:hypothetical protein SADUNF_Sadunf05G0197600 [Salix dunnii]|uniref:Uncharacterized protein n=1 Tax=Salix dunnii TaxID=1413687 RepID=A0A835KCD7_9ROSI|nr:hypothetical protein SADUNF_Sadunf05G0197600 [Salix dunnii]